MFNISFIILRFFFIEDMLNLPKMISKVLEEEEEETTTPQKNYFTNSLLL